MLGLKEADGLAIVLLFPIDVRNQQADAGRVFRLQILFHFSHPPVILMGGNQQIDVTLEIFLIPVAAGKDSCIVCNGLIGKGALGLKVGLKRTKLRFVQQFLRLRIEIIQSILWPVKTAPCQQQIVNTNCIRAVSVDGSVEQRQGLFIFIRFKIEQSDLIQYITLILEILGGKMEAASRSVCIGHSDLHARQGVI